MISKEKGKAIMIEQIARNLSKMIPKGKTKKTVKVISWEGMPHMERLKNLRPIVVEESIFEVGTLFWATKVTNNGVILEVEENLEPYTKVDYVRPSLRWTRKDWDAFFEHVPTAPTLREKIAGEWNVEL